MASKWFVECQRYFIEGKEVNSKGNHKSIPVTIRKMHIHGNFIGTDYYRITLVKRKGEVSFCVKERKKPIRPWWDKVPKTIIKSGPVVDGLPTWEVVDENKMVREGSYTREQFIKRLGGWIGGDALAAVVDLETCPPEKLAA